MSILKLCFELATLLPSELEFVLICMFQETSNKLLQTGFVQNTKY